MAGLMRVFFDSMVFFVPVTALVALAYFSGALTRFRQSKPEYFAATFFAIFLFGFAISFSGANAQAVDNFGFAFEAKGTTGEESVAVRVDGTTVEEVDLTTSTQNYEVAVPAGTSWGQVSIFWPDGFAGDGTNMDIDVFSFSLFGDQRQMVAGDVEVSGQWTGTSCSTLGDPIGNRLHCQGSIVFPAAGPPAPPPPTSSTTSTIPASGAFVVINEIFYNPADGDDGDAEFVELHNPGDTDIDLTGFTFDDEESLAEGETVTLSGNLPSGGYAILTPSGFDAVERWGVTPIATMSFGLSGSGDVLTLLDADGALVDEVAYDDKAPWPVAADGDGPSAELLDPLSNNALGGSWAASSGGPTPGAVNSVVGTAPSVAVSSVSATPFEPSVNQGVTVVASAPVGSANPTLYYVVDFGSESSLAMTDNGIAPDVTAGDGVFTALIPGQGAGDLIRYRI